MIFFGREFNSAWSEPHFHELHTELETYDNLGKLKRYKQPGRILNIGGVPNTPGIYLIRDIYKTNIYVGQTEKQGIRTRLSQHLNAQGSKGLKRGILYEIRWAETYGLEIEKIAEAVAVVFFQPKQNPGNDWKGNLRKALQNDLEHVVIAEAKRLGFLRGSGSEKERFMAKLLEISR
ncbi:GIY-YIG nuclease family protein [Oscillatoria sp. FACHB-1406]|uniref:GIY-YIG nuclease family protein n=1 Tax=Oscillatoria sp. FACHB-1406 TaxID=2692846 RepID=UPI001681F5AD|nr:GIY-YIG nuclease family protein [Oscillatoria sp. FACHB-1406]MBD2576540.1 GIY-YIG nuclease family protein [Oscillatoria sp. FACHB-1406]